MNTNQNKHSAPVFIETHPNSTLDWRKKTSYLTKSGIRDILRRGSVQFIVANVGDKLKIIDIEKCFDFWKNEVEKHLVETIHKIDLDCYPDNYAYIASEWTGKASLPIILLGKEH